MRRIIVVGILILLFMLAGFAFKKPTIKSEAFSAQAQMEGLIVTSRQDSTTEWVLQANSAMISEDGSMAILKNVFVQIPQRNIDVSAESGSFAIKDSVLNLIGNVTAQTPQYKVQIAAVTVKGGEELVSNEKVLIEGKGIRIEGKGLRAKDNAFILKDIRALVY